MKLVLPVAQSPSVYHYLFIGYVAVNEALYTYLQLAGYVVIFKPTLSSVDKEGGGYTNGNVDAELVLCVPFGLSGHRCFLPWPPHTPSLYADTAGVLLERANRCGLQGSIDSEVWPSVIKSAVAWPMAGLSRMPFLPAPVVR